MVDCALIQLSNARALLCLGTLKGKPGMSIMADKGFILTDIMSVKINPLSAIMWVSIFQHFLMKIIFIRTS